MPLHCNCECDKCKSDNPYKHCGEHGEGCHVDCTEGTAETEKEEA